MANETTQNAQDNIDTITKGVATAFIASAFVVYMNDVKNRGDAVRVIAITGVVAVVGLLIGKRLYK